MTLVSQSFAMTPYQTGTVNTASQYVAACQLTNTRMVFTYIQVGPVRRMISIVDNPNGLSDAGTPTYTGAAYSDAVNYVGSGSVKMERLNDTTFMIMYNPNNNTAWTTEVFTVSGTIITKQISQTLSFNNANIFTVSGLSFSKYQQSVGVTPIADNVFITSFISEIEYTNYYGADQFGQSVAYYQWTWNPTALTITTTATNVIPVSSSSGLGWGYRAFSSNSGSYIANPAYLNPDFYYTKIFGSTNTFIVARGSVSVPNSFTTYIQPYFRIVSNTGSLGTATLITANTDIGSVNATRRVQASWNSAYYSNPNDLTSQGGGTFPVSTVGDISVSTPFTMGIDDNYHAVIDRRHFSNTANPFQMKIVRREDSNMIFPSASSTGAYGFTVNVPKLEVPWSSNRPFLLADRSIMWWGVNLATGKFGYNILKNPPLPSS